MEMILSRAPGQVIAALMGEHGMEALEIVVTLTDLEVDARLRHRDIVLARVLRVVKGAGGVLVDLGRDGTGFLPAGQPVLTRRPRGEGWQTTDRPQEGQTVLAQVARLAQAGGETAKGPRLTGEIQVPGRACVYRLTAPADQRLRASRQMDASAAALLRTWIDPCLGEGDGFVLRTAAARLEPDAVVAEASALRAQGLEVLADARDRTPPYRVWRDGPPIARILRDWVGPAGARITVDDAILARTVEQVLTGGLWPDIKIARLPHGRDCDGAFDIEGQIEALTARHVPLSGGGSVVIDSTEALTAIDVNGGGQTGLEANLEAAREIARQIRLRDIGGLIVVDFIDLQDERQRERVVAALKQGLAVDGAAMRIGDFSRFGTLELTRARSGAGIADTWMRVCPTCGGSGRVATLDAAGLALLRALRSGRPTGAVAVGPALAGWIEDHGTAIAAAFTEMGRVAPPFRPSEDLGPLGWRIDGSI